MKTVKVAIDYPWCGVQPDEYEFEVEDNATEDEIAEQATEILNDMIWNRISTRIEVEGEIL